MDGTRPAPAGSPADGTVLTARGLRMVRLGPDEVVVKRGVAEVRVAFTGAASTLDRLVALADGTITEDRLVASFAPEHRDEVRRLVAGLRRRGLLHGEVDEDPAAVFWSSLAPYAPDGRDRLRAATVLLLGTGPVAEQVAGALRACGVGRVDTAPAAPEPPAGAPSDQTRWDLWCAADTGSPHPLLVPAARAALAARAVFLPVWIDDLTIHVGPLTHPYDTACLRCYLLRRDANDPRRDVHRLLREQAGPPPPATVAHLPTMTTVAGDIAATEAVKHLSGLPVTVCGRAIELGLVPFRADVHRVLRVPRCPDCCGTGRRGAPVVAHGPQMTE